MNAKGDAHEHESHKRASGEMGFNNVCKIKNRRRQIYFVRGALFSFDTRFSSNQKRETWLSDSY
jgi:hypothetical protein